MNDDVLTHLIVTEGRNRMLMVKRDEIALNTSGLIDSLTIDNDNLFDPHLHIAVSRTHLIVDVTELEIRADETQ